MTKSTDHWRTHPEDIADILRYFRLDLCAACGGKGTLDAWSTLTRNGCTVCMGSGRNRLAGFDLDVASNEGSVVRCRVSLQYDGGPIERVDASVVLQTPVTVGGGGVNACGITIAWDPRLLVWCNPPYSSPAPWVVRMLLHAWAGGRGVAILPQNLLEGAWGQALLWLAGVRRVAFAQVPVSEAHAVLGPLFHGKGVSTSTQREYQDMIQSPPVGKFGLYIPSRRIGFIDTDGIPKNSNRIGTMIIAWGMDTQDSKYSGVHTVTWPRRIYPANEKFPVIETATNETE